MKKFFKTLTSSALTLALLAGSAGATTLAVSAAETEDLNKVTVDGRYMYNGYIKMSVDMSSGQFVFGTTGGNPDSDTDNDKMLLYGFPDSIWSSYSTIVIDDVKNRYHSTTKTEKPVYSDVAKQNSSTASYLDGKVTASQVLSFVRNVSTNRDDVVEVKYVLTNEDTVEHNVGVRIMFDTKLGSNDRAPFRVAGVGDVTTETTFEGDAIPQYWQAFDDLASPTVISQGSFLRDGDAVNNPDKVQFCNWGRVDSTPWEYETTEGRENGDSAVAVTWYQKPLAPGESRVYTTYYGMSELTQNTDPPLSLSMYSDSIVTAKSVDQATGNPVYNTFTVTGYVQNIGNEATHNTYAKLVLPSKMSIVGDSAVKTIGVLDAGKIQQVTWVVKTAGDITVGDHTLKVLAGCDETTEKNVERKVSVPAILKNNSKVQKAHLTIGDEININAAAEGGYGTYLYAMSYRKTGTNTWTKIQDYGTKTTASVKPSASVPYEVLVKVKDGNGSIADRLINVNVYKKLVNKSTAPSVVNLGNALEMKGAAAEGSGSFKYAYYYKKSSATKWTTLKDYTTAVKASFKPAAVGTYDLKVVVKDTKTGKTAAKTFKTTVKDPLVNTSTVSAEVVVLGKNVTVNASAKGGKAGYQYAVFYKNAEKTKWNTKQAMGTNATVTMTFDEAGKYDICVHAKDAEGTVDKKYFTVTVNKPLTNTSKVDTTSVIAGESVKITASAKDGAGDYKYSVYYKKSTATKWTTKQNASANSSITFTPQFAGKYQLSVKAIDKDGTVARKLFTITVGAKLKNTSKLSASTINLGKSVTVNASATGGKGDYQYAVFYKKASDKRWTIKQSYKPNATVVITPKVATKYQVCVKVKDARGNVEEKKYLDLVVEKGLKNTSTITVGDKVTLNGSATGNVGNVTYAFAYKRSTATKWVNKQSFAANAKVTVAAKKGVSYDYCIKVKDSDGNIQKKYFTVKIG